MTWLWYALAALIAAWTVYSLIRAYRCRHRCCGSCENCRNCRHPR